MPALTADRRLTRLAVRGGVLALAAVAVGFLYMLATVRPTDDSYYPRCQLHASTGLHCPGCGTTRALHSLLNGRVVEALRFNALFPIVLPVLTWVFLHSVRVSRGRASPTHSRTGVWGFALLSATVVLYGVLRNVPIYPFTLLAPPGP